MKLLDLCLGALMGMCLADCGVRFQHKPLVGYATLPDGSTIEVYRGAQATWQGWNTCTIYVKDGHKISEMCTKDKP